VSLNGDLKVIIALSHFHTKIGPRVWCSYPKGQLDKETSKEIAEVMNQTFNEGFYVHTSENVISMNYYFEIHSDWARGHKEVLMASIILDRRIPHEVEVYISQLCSGFSARLQSNEDNFTAFYIDDLKKFDEKDKGRIKKHNTLIRERVIDLYLASLEILREKSEEEKIAILLKDVCIFETLEKLSKGPIPIEWLREWFIKEFPEIDFQDIIEKLQDTQFIFINQIGLIEKYILLLREVKIERIPPKSVISQFDENPSLIGLLIPKIQEYFDEYEEKSKEELKKDTFLIFDIIADSKKYKILSELRKGIILKDELVKLVSEKSSKLLKDNVEFLKKNEVIEELNDNSDIYLVLKTDLQISTAFSGWLRKSVPEREEF
jgi:hypothetical protein